jgi:hypothetical protein
MISDKCLGGSCSNEPVYIWWVPEGRKFYEGPFRFSPSEHTGRYGTVCWYEPINGATPPGYVGYFPQLRCAAHRDTNVPY